MTNSRFQFLLSGLVLLTLALFVNGCLLETKEVEWSEYLGGSDRNHYSSLEQVDTNNVSQLEKVWEFHTGDTSGQMQCNPIIANGMLYGSTASIEIFALNAATGKEIWRFRDVRDEQWYSTNRGVAYWELGGDSRILFSAGGWLYALNAKTGKLVTSFGDSGRVSLKTGLGETAKDKFVIASTPGTIYRNSIIMPLRLSEGNDAAPGFIQSFDIITGKLKWVFKTIPGPGEPGYETWEQNNHLNQGVGGANSWAGMSVDRKKGILYVPTGSAAFDFYGGNRKGDNLYANCLLALNAKTGELIWHYQFTHHDVWDRDLPAPPNLVTLNMDGKIIEAVAQVTKQGYVFVFERTTGKPVYEIEEVTVPTDGVAGEVLSPTQPRPVKPAPFARQSFTEEDISPFAENREALIQQYRQLRKGWYAPPSTEGTIIFPGFDGGAEWGGASFDEETGYLYVNANEMPWILKINHKKNSTNNSLSFGNGIYINNCASCHGADKKGRPSSGYPSLEGIKDRKSESQIAAIVAGGKGMMPGFPALKPAEKKAVLDYLLDREQGDKIEVVSKEKGSDLPYEFDGYNKFLDNKGYPGVKPPWGTLTAINLNTGEHAWRLPFGSYPELEARGIKNTGSENYGGGVVTKGGLFFIGATRDNKARAYNKLTGKQLWEAQLSASSFASPSVFQINGNQYIVFVCGGSKLGTNKGDSYIAFALKK
jgi:quinoprotein glucose dehydrogenase